MDFPPSEQLDSKTFCAFLDHLHVVLQSLPSQLLYPSSAQSKYAAFLNFELDPDVLDRTESREAAFNEGMKSVFGWKTRTTGDGLLAIDERGPAICAVVDVLRRFHKEFPANEIIKKWAYDIAHGTVKIYMKHGKEIPSADQLSTRKQGGILSFVTDTSTPVQSTPATTDASDSEDFTIESLTIDRFKNLRLVSATQKTRGRRLDPLLMSITKRFQSEDGKEYWGCAAHPRCQHINHGKPAKGRALRHATKCCFLDHALKQWAIKEAGDGSLGAQLEQDDDEEASEGPDVSNSTKKREIGLVEQMAMESGRKKRVTETMQMQKRVDHCILKLICVCGLVPDTLDSEEWREFVQTLNPKYSPTSATTFRGVYIPQEAVFVRSEALKRVSKADNLTCTFDGGSTRQESVYTVHVTTPSRRSFFIDSHEGATESHNTTWLKEKLLMTIDEIGRERFAAINSDNTAVTKAARREVVAQIPTIMNLHDPMHHLSLTIKGITELVEFKWALGKMKPIVRHAKKSSKMRALLSGQRQVGTEDERVKELQKPGKTRFGSYWSAVTSLLACLSNIRMLVMGKHVKFKDKSIQAMFSSRISADYQKLEQGLTMYEIVVAPFIRSLWSLESCTAMASDTFVFWLAIGAQLEEFRLNRIIPLELLEKIIAIYNKRFDEFFDASHMNIYFTAFCLDPRYPLSDYLFKSAVAPEDPPSPLKIVINRRTKMPHPKAYERVKNALKDTLRQLVDYHQRNPEAPGHAIIKELGGTEIIQQFRAQLESFWTGCYPFNKPLKDDETVYNWWVALRNHPDARVMAFLAERFFAILPNSMPDERTASRFTWLNSAVRGNQKASTVADMVMIGQWYGQHMKPQKQSRRPAVKFRDINKDILNVVVENTKTDINLRVDIDSEDEDWDQNESHSSVAEYESDSDDADSNTPDFSSIVGESTVMVDSDVDLNSPALLDLLSLTPIQLPKKQDKTSSSKPDMPRKEITDDDWNF